MRDHAREEVTVPVSLVIDQFMAMQATHMESVRAANVARAQRDVLFGIALRHRCAAMDGAGDCPDQEIDPCMRAFGWYCGKCRKSVLDEVRYAKGAV